MRLRVVLWFAVTAAAEQLALQPTPSDAEAMSETLMSVLSASAQHKTFVHLLQRAKLVPMLSKLNGTLFAPTDEAWAAWEEAHRPEDDIRTQGWLGAAGLAEWTEDRVHTADVDNQNWALRQHLLYHVLNYTIKEDDWAPRSGSNVTLETSLLYPVHQQPPPSPIPEPGTPWLPPGANGMLGPHGQRIRLAVPGTAEGGDRGRVGFDHTGEGGAVVWNGTGWDEPADEGKDKDKKPKPKPKHTGVRWARNGLVVGVESVLEPPKSMLEVMRDIPQLQYLSRLLDTGRALPKPLPPWLDRTPHVTLFAASDEAFASTFDDIDRSYLEGAYGAEGLVRVLSPAFLRGVNKKVEVGWSDAFDKKERNVTTASDTLVISSNGTMFVNGTTPQIADILCSNGVIHIMPKVLVPDGFELLNSAEKVLLGHNATRFVSLMRSANLSSTYIGEPGKKMKKEWTILAPTDDAIEYMEWWSRLPFPNEFDTLEARDNLAEDSPLAALLKYHILPGHYAPKDLDDDMMLGTELKTALLAGDRQRIHVDISKGFADKEIRFGDAPVVDYVKSDNSMIYFVSAILSPPLDTIQTAVGDLQLSTYIAAVYAAGLERTIKRNPATTYFIPRNSAFDNSGLLIKYLLLPEGRDELRKVLKYHAVEKLIYTPDIETGLTVYKSMEGGNIVLERTENNTFAVRSPTKWPNHDSGASLPANGDPPAAMSKRNALTETGVIHLLDSVVMPANIDITIAKLIHGSRQRTMVELMVKAGLSWILEGREPSQDEADRVNMATFKNDSDTLAYPAYTVLVPTDKAFSRLNLTLYGEPEALLQLLKLHIIPSPKGMEAPVDGQPLALSDDVVYPTLLAQEHKFGELAFRAVGESDFLVGVRGARGAGETGARTGVTGRASVRWRRGHEDELRDDKSALGRGGMALGGGVILLDAVLEPYNPGWYERWGWLVLVVTGSVLLFGLLAGCVWWWYITTRRRREGYERVAQEEDEREQEQQNRLWRRQSRDVNGANGNGAGN